MSSTSCKWSWTVGDAIQVAGHGTWRLHLDSGRPHRDEDIVHAAVMVLATDKADVNKTVRKELGMRKMSFADQPTVEELAGMTQGGITPVGLPEDWPILIDEAVVAAGPVVIGGGVRGSKILVDGAELTGLPGARVLPLALPTPTVGGSAPVPSGA